MAVTGGSVVFVDLPSINGNIEAGITVGVDSSLPDENKLPILYQGGRICARNLVKVVAGHWATRQRFITDAQAKSLLLNGIIGLIDLGLLTTCNDIPDGDWKKIQAHDPITEEESREIAKAVTQENVAKAIAIIVTTKANFWLLNHHTGQGQVQGYVKKILDVCVFYGGNVTEQVVTAAYTLGHYTSTLKILTIAEVRSIRPSDTIIQCEGSNLTLSQDAKLRFQSMPAGTHRLGVAYESAKRLVRGVYAKYCPGLSDFTHLPRIREMVMGDPARYHVGASYLTG